ncbi:RNA-binding protein [Pseudobacillus wudalianchiensis]|uniref:RNA-binding protein n=1 Tax=Pseudobacillus wudalianchiensis TaxID=1743143 RepID=A0A1B9AJE5_9BACI|nr:RNA-binding protein [Bacillus wudalianchiensis]OCA83901.1 RNA-binding protein [Bacillus wudalianchiensis]
MSSIYQHFRPEEKEFIDQVFEWKREAAEMYAPKLTDFLDPREQEIVRSVVGAHGDTAVFFFGGTAHTERKRAYICPSYFTPVEKEFDIVLYELHYPDKFVSIAHPQVLGSLMGLGLRRRKFGDILTDGKRVQFLAAKEVSHYIEVNLNRIGKTAVTLDKKSPDEAIAQEEEWKEISTTVSSLRLDAVLSAFMKQSRQKVQMAIKGGLVKVNWKQQENPAFECTEGDVFSVRGAGRAKLLTVEGQTKKEKWRIVLGIVK